MKELEAIISKHQQALDRLKKSTSKIEEDVRGLQNKILEVGGVRLRVQKSKVDSIHEQIVALNERITKTQVAKNTAEKSVTKLTSSIEKKEAELNEINSSLEEISKEIQDKTSAAVDVKIKADSAKAVSIFYSFLTVLFFLFLFLFYFFLLLDE